MQEIRIELIKPNPFNPRKDLGDLTELTESIKVNGIMQNLTVVENKESDYELNYICVIGHRRLAAAKLAGLETVPCNVAELSEAEQASLMLAENMQRNDLTTYEQVKGIQQCMDFGFTEDQIAERTGFSKVTIRKRASLTKYPDDQLKKWFDANVTLEDFAKINSLKKEEDREIMLTRIGSRNFDYFLNQALIEQEDNEAKPKLIKLLASFAQKKGIEEYYSSETEDAKIVEYFRNYADDLKNFKKPKDAEKVQYYYDDSSSYQIDLFKVVPSKKDDEPDLTMTGWRTVKAQVDKVEKIYRRVWIDFAQTTMYNYHFTDQDTADYFHTIFVGLGRGQEPNDEVFEKITGKDIDNVSFKRSGDQFAAIFSMLMPEQGTTMSYSEGDGGSYYDDSDESMRNFYRFIKSYGYVPGEMEQQFIDGTHDCYKVPKKEEKNVRKSKKAN